MDLDLIIDISFCFKFNSVLHDIISCLYDIFLEIYFVFPFAIHLFCYLNLSVQIYFFHLYFLNHIRLLNFDTCLRNFFAFRSLYISLELLLLLLLLLFHFIFSFINLIRITIIVVIIVPSISTVFVLLMIVMVDYYLTFPIGSVCSLWVASFGTLICSACLCTYICMFWYFDIILHIFYVNCN